MADKIVTKKYVLGGLNLAAPLDKADPNQALICKDLVNYVGGGKTPRPGDKIIVDADLADHLCGYGIAKYSYYSAGANDLVNNLLFMSDGSTAHSGLSLFDNYELMTIAYSDTPGYTVSYSCYANKSGTITVSLTKYDGTLAVVSTVTKEITATTTLAQVETALEAMTGITITFSTAGTYLATGFEIGYTETIAHGASSIGIYYASLSSVPYLGGDGGYLYDYAGIGSWALPQREMPFLSPWTNYNKCMYYSSGYTILKYDGYCCSRAGIPMPANGTVTASSGAGSIAAGTYTCGVTFSIKDNQGNELESDLHQIGNVVLSTTKNIEYDDITLDTTVVDFTGYSIWGAVFDNAGTETGTTLKVDGESAESFNLAIGNYVYFRDNSGTAHERRITNITQGSPSVQGTITIDGSAVTVANDTCVSPIRVNFYRTKIGPSSYFYLEKTMPFDVRIASGQARTDSTIDANLGVRYVEPGESHLPFPYEYSNNAGSPIRGLAMYKGSLCAGVGNRVVYSTVGNVEYFPEEYWFECGIGESEQITALYATEDYLLVFKEKAMYLISGELTTGAFNVDLITSSIGCCSQATIQDVNGTLLWASSTGVYSFVGVGTISKNFPIKISQDIDTIFGETSINEPALSITVSPYARYSLSSAIYDSSNERYILQLCSPLTSSGIYVFDIKAKEWSTWSGNFYGGAIFIDGDRAYEPSNDLFFVSQNTGVAGFPFSVRRSLITTGTYQVSNFIQGVGEVPYQYQSCFETLEEPSALKSPIRARVETLKPRETRYSLLGSGSTIFNCYKDYAQEGVDGNPSYSYKTITFGSRTQNGMEQSFRITPNKCRAFGFGIEPYTGNAAIQPTPIITGVEIQYKVPYTLKFKEPSQ